DRLNAQAVAAEFLSEVVRLAEKQGLISDEHFSVDGTLLQAWASQKSFRPKDDTPDDPAPRPAQCPAGLQGAQAQQRHPRLDQRSGCPAVPKEPQHRRAAELLGACADGTPQWPGAQCSCDSGLWPWRTRSRAGNAEQAGWSPSTHPGRGQGLRHGRLRGRLSRPRRDTPCCAERQWSAQRQRRPYHASCWLWTEPEVPRLDRNPLRLAQGGGRPAPGEATRT